MNIFVLAFGTRGDVQPMLAIAKALQCRGHRVNLCAPDNFRNFVETEHGVPFHPIGVDFQKIMEHPEVKGRGESGIRKVITPQIPRILQAAAAAASAAASTAAVLVTEKKSSRDQTEAGKGGLDIILSQVNFFGGADLAEAHGAALVTVSVAPCFPTSEFPFFFVSSARSLPLGCLNRASYAVAKLARATTRAPLKKWREETLGLTTPSPSLLGMGCRIDGTVAQRLCVVSPSVVPLPHDWDSATTHMSGYLALGDPLGRKAPWTPDANLQAFLDDSAQKGLPVVYIGFGSMTQLSAEELASMVVPATRAAGVRTLVALGWSTRNDTASSSSNARGRKYEKGPPEQLVSPDVFYLNSAPHPHLFPLLAATVHHGGAGTTAASLSAGKPTFVCPVGADQFFWGQRVHMLGCGPAPVALSKLTSAVLAVKLRELARTDAFRDAARDLAARIAAEDGLSEAVRIVEEVEGVRVGKKAP